MSEITYTAFDPAAFIREELLRQELAHYELSQSPNAPAKQLEIVTARIAELKALLPPADDVDPVDTAETERLAEIERQAKIALGRQAADAKVVAEIDGVEDLADAEPSQILEAVEKVKAAGT